MASQDSELPKWVWIQPLLVSESTRTQTQQWLPKSGEDSRDAETSGMTWKIEEQPRWIRSLQGWHGPWKMFLNLLWRLLSSKLRNVGTGWPYSDPHIWNFYYLNVLPRVLLLSQNVHAQNKILISQLLLISIRVMEEVVAFPSLPAFAKTTILLSSALLKPCSHPWHVHFYQPSYQVNHHSTEQPTKNQERRSKNLWKTKPILFLFKIT